MSTPPYSGWPQPQPQRPTPTQRPWYKKKRFLLPIGTVAALAIGGQFVDEPVTPAAQQPLVQVVETTTTLAPSPTEESTAEADAQATADAEAAAAAKAEKARKAKALKAKKLKAAKLKKARARAAAEERRRQEKEEANDVYYANCTAVRAAGAAPIRTGDPGYSRKLDRDGDGVACE